MRTLRLAGVAAQAERLRLRCLVRRMAIRATLAAIAAVFLLLALAGGHVAVVIRLARSMPTEHAVLWVVAGDVVIAIVLAVIALRLSRPGRSEREARLVRRQAMLPLYDMVSVGRAAMRVERLWLRMALLLLQFVIRRRAR